MTPELSVWVPFNAEKETLLNSLQRPIPNLPPVLALNTESRSSSRAILYEKLSTLQSHITHIEALVEELAAAKRHLEQYAARIHTSLAPIAALTPSILSQIFHLSGNKPGRPNDAEILCLSLVCSSWRDIVQHTSELFTRWRLRQGSEEDIVRMIQFRSLRAKGRHISVEIRRSVMKHLFTSIPPGGDQSKSPEWATLKNELEKLSPRYSRLQFELSADNDCSNISEWLSHQDLRHLRRLVILGNSAYSASSDKIALPSIPQINSLRVSHVVVTGDLSNVQSLTCFANTSTDWSPWSALIHSCVQLHFLKLTIPNAPMEGNLVIDLPSLKELQVGRPAVHGRGSLTWCERFGSLIGSLRAPNLRSMTIFNTRISSSHEEASIWPALYQAVPQINTLKLVEKYAFSNPASSFICLDALCEPSNSNGFLFPLVEHLGIFAIPTPSKTAHEKLMTLIENRVSTTSLVRFSVSSKLCTSLKGEYGDALDGFQSTFPNFKILDVPEERVPELWP